MTHIALLFHRLNLSEGKNIQWRLGTNTLLDKMFSQYAVSWREELNNHTEKNIKQENKGQNKDCYMLKGMKEVIFGQ